MSPAVRIRIRRMDLKDVEQVYAIDVLSFSLPWPERSYRFELTENRASRPWVAEWLEEDRPPRIVAMLVLWLLFDEAHIGTIAVHPDFRQYGIGRRLLAAALLNAIEGGATTSLLEVRRGNLSAQKLYEAFGFEVVNIRPRYYSDNGEDALLMTLNGLDPGALRRLLADRPGQPPAEVVA